MKCLSLWQPWASLMAAGLKRYETRHWQTSYRGPIAIHAARKVAPEARSFGEDLAYASGEEIRRALDALPCDIDDRCWITLGQSAWPAGVVLATGVLVDCIPTERLLNVTAREEEFGNFADGRFAWQIDQMKPLTPPPILKGQQGLFDLPQGWMCG
jgi:hypothetical protein